jgi:hypothetical protein
MVLEIGLSYWNTDVKSAVNMSFLKEVSQKHFVLKLSTSIFEGSLAKTLRFEAFNFHF